jgi:hypothetical protein
MAKTQQAQHCDPNAQGQFNPHPGLGSGPINLRRSTWKFDVLRHWLEHTSDARYQWFGFRRKGWLPLQGSHGPKDEGVHFSMPVTPEGCQQNGIPLA